MESANSKTNEEELGKDLALATMDPKKLKRVLASRQYSHRYRMKQIQYMLHLETEVKALQAEVAINFPRIKYVDHQNFLLRMENRALKQRLSAISSELMFKEAQCDEIRKEKDALKKLHAAEEKDVWKKLQAAKEKNALKKLNDKKSPPTP
ncbi:Basic leucine zipper 2 [Euphorbia peplus]|nr:Basic leucine zipper 2 [Euphorbia peplus]